MTVDKSSATAVLSAPGAVSYSYLVTNTGNVTLTGVSLADDNVDFPGVSCPSTTIAAGAAETSSADHTSELHSHDTHVSPLALSSTQDNKVTTSSNEAPAATH